METRPLESSSQIVREQVRRRYGATARGETSSCGDGCCSSTSADILGYSAEESAIAPEGANLGLGCGNPLAIASLRAGQVVLDLGSEFRLGEIEALPVADNSIDVIISNCVINLSPEKQRVFDEAFRVLQPGGRLAVADMVATAPLPDDIKSDWAAYTGCMAGASQVTDLQRMIEASGFENIEIAPKDSSRSFIREWLPGKRVEDYLVSATIEAVKPRPALT